MNPFLFQWTCCVYCMGFKKSFTCLHYADHIAKITLLISGCIVINKCVVMPVLLKKKNKTADQCYSLVTAQFYLASKGKCILETWGRANPKEAKRRVRLNFGSSFYVFFSSPLSLPYVNWASQEGCLLHLRFSFLSSDLPWFYFCRLFPFFVL